MSARRPVRPSTRDRRRLALACALALAAGACRSRGDAPAAPVEDAAPARAPDPVPRPATWRHRFRVAAALDRIDARVCFEGRVPARLEPQNRLAREALTHVARIRGRARAPLPISDAGVDLSGLAPGDCVAYTIDVDAVLASARHRPRLGLSARRHGRDLVLSPDYYLLRPAGPLDGAELTATLELPPGVRALVPWPRLDPARPDSAYRIPPTSFSWRIHGALGGFDVDVIEIGGARVRVAVLGSGWEVERAVLLTWIEEAARAVAGLYGGFPVPAAQVLVVPAPGRRVVFGNAAQGGGPSIALLVGVEVTARALREDWLAVHELLHLGMPVVDDSGRWLSEGMATYYEPVVRARAGWISPRRAWELLHDGFQRGSARGSGRTLRAESRDMDETREYWRVYWGGAAIALIADVTLRQHGAPAPPLDAQMRAMRACCLDSPRLWPAEALLAEVAAPGPVPDLASVAAAFLDRSAFPDTGAVYRALGLGFDPDGRLLDPADGVDPAARRLRAAIMGPGAALGPGAAGAGRDQRGDDYSGR